MFSATTTGAPNSMNMLVRYRLRSRFDASTTSTMTSGRSSITKSRATISSVEYAVRL